MYFKNVRRILILSLLLLACQSTNYQTLIDQGEFTRATAAINQILQSNGDLTEQEKFDLRFEIERMQRIRRDFTKTEAEVLEYIKTYKPDVTTADLRRWENEKSLEVMTIDGEQRYFNRAARNLFRIDKECKGLWQAYHKERNIKTDPETMDYYTHNREVISAVTASGKNYVKPLKMQIRYTLTVKPDMVPAGETIRCWIPFPREIPGRQENIRLIDSTPAVQKIAGNEFLQRTAYMEQPSAGSEATTFFIEYEYVNHGAYFVIDADKVVPSDPQGELKPYLAEEPPHIVFSDDLKKLSAEIIGDETNPYRKGQILLEWVYTHTPWASAREYSTIRNLSDYGFRNQHGDCGIQSMLFITLCRLNGIPARWQSGWDFKPPYDTMHDWGMIYFEPYGWMPMDAYYGLHDTDEEDLKWFYLNGMDSYRAIFNDGYAQPFDPPKEFHRSETLDSQRGEVEWSGGNLYFNQWSWDMQYTAVEQ